MQEDNKKPSPMHDIEPPIPTSDSQTDLDATHAERLDAIINEYLVDDDGHREGKARE